MPRKSIQIKILGVAAGLFILALGVSVYFGHKMMEADLIAEKLRASRFVAEPVMTAIYEDMTEERADLVRHMLDDAAMTQGRGKIFIVRSNGVEEAFRDMKTINEVIKVYGKVRPEWLANHANDARNVAIGIYAPEFKEAFEKYRRDWGAGPVSYIEKSEGAPFFVYLQPIETRFKCMACHAGDGARGVLVIRMPLEQMYAALSKNMTRWVFAGLMGMLAGGVLLSLTIRRTVTGPIRRNVETMKAIAEGGRGLGERLKIDVDSEDEIGEVSAALNSLLDTVQRREGESGRLLETATRDSGNLQAALDAMQEMISIHDIDGEALRVNKALANRLKTTQEALTGKRCHDIFYHHKVPHEGCPHKKAVSTRETVCEEFSDMLVGGTCRVLIVPVSNESGEVRAIVHILKDVTVEKLLRDQLVNEEKLACVDKLVAGIAHELNNPLMGVMGYAQLAIDKPGDRPISEITDKLLKIYDESRRASQIVRNLLALVRAKNGERSFHNMNDIIRRMVSLRASGMKVKKIAVSLDLEPGIPGTMMDAEQIQMALLNILNNAEDAVMLKEERGRIDIKTRHSRGNIEVLIKDYGPGIPKECLKKIFDPFFTTKEKGKGTGLNLFIAHEIIIGHGGLMNIFNHEEGGASVDVRVPVVSVAQWSEVKRRVDHSGPA